MYSRKLSKELSFVQSLFFGYCFPYNSYSDDFANANYEFMKDSLMIYNYCDKNDYQIFICNKRQLLAGENGAIFKLSEDCKISWVGLYNRKPLDLNEMIDPYKGGVLGIRKFNGNLWYADIDAKNEYDSFYVSSSTDGKSWRYEFEKHSRIAVDSLTEQNVEKLRRNLYD